MKYILTLLLASCISLTALAQDAATKSTAEKSVADDESKSKKKEADLVEGFKTAGITAEEQVKLREFIKESGEYGKELRADPDFTDEEKLLKAKVYARIKNSRMKELLGEERYLLYRQTVNAIKKRNAETKK